jgi:peptidoglycan hydrolase-like protein with peptidoglycan-binding domain
MSILSLVSTIPSIIAVALRNEDVVAGVRAIASSPLVGVLEAAAEKMFPKVGPALRLAAIALAAFDPDTTKWVQNALNIDLEDELPAPLVVDGDYGPKTIDAVEMFQAKHGLRIDGWAGEVTKALLGAVTQGFKMVVAAAA